MDESIGYLIRKTGQKVIIPGHYYIALLMVKDGGYRAMGFWIQHKEYGLLNSAALNNILDQACSIDYIEEQTGVNLFAALPDDVEDKVESKEITSTVLKDFGFNRTADSSDSDPLIYHDPSTENQEIYEPEDVNMDSSVDSQDIMYIYDYMKNSASTPTSSTREDVNSDQSVDSQDVLSVYEYMKNN